MKKLHGALPSQTCPAAPKAGEAQRPAIVKVHIPESVFTAKRQIALPFSNFQFLANLSHWQNRISCRILAEREYQ
jgi:hypothetical protein